MDLLRESRPLLRLSTTGYATSSATLSSEWKGWLCSPVKSCCVDRLLSTTFAFHISPFCACTNQCRALGPNNIINNYMDHIGMDFIVGQAGGQKVCAWFLAMVIE